MRILVLTIAVMGMLAAAGQARAQTYDPNFPVCMHIAPVGGGTYDDCSYFTLASVRCQPPAARPSATSTRSTRERRRHRDQATGGIAAAIETQDGKARIGLTASPARPHRRGDRMRSSDVFRPAPDHPFRAG